MNILVYYPHAEDAAIWQRSFADALPQADVRLWTPGDTAAADYAIVWRPPSELFAPRAGLRAIFVLGAGVDALLALERREPGTLPREVPLVRLEDTGMADQMAEYVLHGVLRYQRRFDEYEIAQRRDVPSWQPLAPHPRETFTVGVLGLGALGSHVARALASFGLPVRGYSRSEKRVDGIATYAGEPQLDAFLDGLKVLVNLLPSTPDTDGILGQRTFARLAHGAYVINVARGAHLIENDLFDALASGQIAAATLDVFSEEPLSPTHRFWREPRITITPHISALTLREPSVAQIAAKIEALSRGEPVTGVVDVTRGY